MFISKVYQEVLEKYKLYFSRINDVPIIVLGHQKAGTSAIAALLGKASDKTVTIDFFHRNNARFPNFREKLYSGQMDFSKFINSNKIYFSRDIIKEPDLTFYYQELLDFFPKSKFIFVVRDPRDNIRSILNRLKIPGDLEVLTPEIHVSLSHLDGWKSAISGKAPDVLGKTYIERLAHRWNLAAAIYLNNAEHVTLIRYEDFKANKIDAIGKLAKAVNLEVKRDISSEINIQFQPRGNSDTSLSRFFGKKNLEKIEMICHEKMKSFQYFD